MMKSQGNHLSIILSTICILSFGLVHASGLGQMGVRSMDLHHNPTRRDAYTDLTGSNNNEGEDHSPVKAPSGSVFTSLPVGSNGETIAAFWSANPQNSTAKRAFIVIHGKLRNGDSYWSTLNNVLKTSAQANYPGASDSSIIVAPEFFSTKYNSGEYDNDMLAWGDTNQWQAGAVATHPSGTTLSAFDALDSLVQEFLDTSKYPMMTNITIVGHGGGGQLNQRYAMVAKQAPNSTPHIRYIHGDPSSCAYFTDDRPIKMSGGESIPSKSSCNWFNYWRYGFVNFTGTANGLKTPQQYFQNYITRDVVSIIALNDTSNNGDQTCMGKMQGGQKRRDRNLSWWQYINILARTNEDLTGFPATFGNLPDYSNISNNQISVRLTVVPGAGHNDTEVFSSDEGRAALFADEVPTGWRPQGWQPAPSSSVNSRAAQTNTQSSTPSTQTKSNNEVLLQSSAMASNMIKIHFVWIAFILSLLAFFT